MSDVCSVAMLLHPRFKKSWFCNKEFDDILITEFECNLLKRCQLVKEAQTQASDDLLDFENPDDELESWQRVCLHQ